VNLKTDTNPYYVNMNKLSLNVREMNAGDIEDIIDYWLFSTADHLEGMGVDLNKMPDRETWRLMISEQLGQTYEEKKSYCMIWEIDGKSSGHSNVNRIVFGEDAYMHLHLWNDVNRRKGTGSELVKLTLPHFFNKLNLKKIYCEPYSLNPAPNKVLEKLGFRFVKEHYTIPGYLNFEQPVKLWELDRKNAVM
jgi:RimJ/RimL family protein N-acetyltransferase